MCAYSYCLYLNCVCLQNPLLEGGDLSTMIAIDPKTTQVDEFGNSTYRNRRTVSAEIL